MRNKPDAIQDQRNKAIAIFLGGKIDTEYDTWDFPTNHVLLTEMTGYGTTELMFNKDWNWLMLAVDRIERLAPLNIGSIEYAYPVHFTFTRTRTSITNVPLEASCNNVRWADFDNCSAYFYGDPLNRLCFETRILATFKVVGDFCIWFNENKNRNNPMKTLKKKTKPKPKPKPKSKHYQIAEITKQLALQHDYTIDTACEEDEQLPGCCGIQVLFELLPGTSNLEQAADLAACLADTNQVIFSDTTKSKKWEFAKKYAIKGPITKNGTNSVQLFIYTRAEFNQMIINLTKKDLEELFEVNEDDENEY